MINGTKLLQVAPTVDASMLPKDTSGIAPEQHTIPTLAEMGYPPTDAPVGEWVLLCVLE